MGAPNKVELKKGPWTREEDQKLLAYIDQHGHGSWRTLPDKAGLQRCGKSCRLRWTNYLRPDIKRGKFSTHEEKAIIRLHALLGNRWSAISAHIPKRTDNEIKNYWNTRLKKRLTRMGIDPVTHKPKNNPPGSAHSSRAASLSHMAQWEAARLEAEARLARESRLVSNLQLLHKATAPPPPPSLAAPPCLDVLKVWQAIAIPSCFFSSPGTLESPTSTLNFSSNSIAVPAVSSVWANDVISMNNYGACGVAQAERSTEMKGKMENSTQLHDDDIGYPSSVWATDVISMNNYGACGVAQAESSTEMKGKMENSTQLHDDDIGYPVGCDFNTMGSMDLATYNHDPDGCNMVGPVVGEFEWSGLLDLVSSSMELPKR